MYKIALLVFIVSQFGNFVRVSEIESRLVDGVGQLVLQDDRRSGLGKVLRLLLLHRGVDVLPVVRLLAQPDGQSRGQDCDANDDGDRHSGDEDDVQVGFVAVVVAAWTAAVGTGAGEGLIVQRNLVFNFVFVVNWINVFDGCCDFSGCCCCNNCLVVVVVVDNSC